MWLTSRLWKETKMLNIAGIEWRQNINKCVNAPTKAPIFALEFCRQGRIEWASGILPCNHLESGEMLICNPWALSSLKRSQDYKGELILFYEEAKDSIRTIFAGFDLNLDAFKTKFKINEKPFIVHTREEIQAVFGKLSRIKENMHQEYARLGLLEILLTLKNMDASRESICRDCNISMLQVEKVYGIRSFICDNIDSHYTIEELAEKFDMPPTAMKLCFKNVFGLPVFTYARRERMKLAAKQLRECDRGILEIAGEVGYNNGSKFAHAFQDVMGMTPKEYRKKYRLTNVA